MVQPHFTELQNRNENFFLGSYPISSSAGDHLGYSTTSFYRITESRLKVFSELPGSYPISTPAGDHLGYGTTTFYRITESE